jgi:hypothetical protein
MVISAPEATTWVPFSKTRKGLEHFPSRVGFEHNLSSLNGVPLWDVNQEMNMVQSKTKVTEFESKAFQIVECLNAGVDVDLLSEAAISVVGDEHHGHPVITGVTRNLFRATAIYNIHEFFSPVALLKEQVFTCCTRQKENCLSKEKRDATFHLRVFHFVSDHAVFPVATIKKNYKKLGST